ncbi:MAG: 3'-5' exonuclease, partial [Candidatus Omnitrophica bacterium]|nr:3'-5' exonuclease [Candidatus Omnitrophota bacterium]
MELSRTLVVLDLETTGTWVEKDKIIEIAMVRLAPDGRQDIFEKRVNPGIPIPAVVTQLTGISDADVSDAAPFNEIAGLALEFIGDADLAGFNIERFDLPLLERELREAGQGFEWKSRNIFDAQKIYHLHEKRDLSAAYAFYCQKPLVNAHAALADVNATLEILQAQLKRYCPEAARFETLQKFEYEVRDEFYDEEKRFRWWNGNLYMMFGRYARQFSLAEI